MVNVSAMEGKFYRHKQPTHPHTCDSVSYLHFWARVDGDVVIT